MDRKGDNRADRDGGQSGTTDAGCQQTGYDKDPEQRREHDSFPSRVPTIHPAHETSGRSSEQPHATGTVAEAFRPT
jgi:hypothetical protein